MALNNACRHLAAEQKVIEPEMLKILSQSEGVSLSFRRLYATDHGLSTSAAPPNELPAILRREAVYCALGRLSRSLSVFGGLDFNAFLAGIASWLGQGLPLYVTSQFMASTETV